LTRTALLERLSFFVLFVTACALSFLGFVPRIHVDLEIKNGCYFVTSLYRNVETKKRGWRRSPLTTLLREKNIKARNPIFFS
jgi:hypothetical protein